MHKSNTGLLRIQTWYLGTVDKKMANKVKRDSSVRDIVRALVDGVITPRHAVVKLEKLVDANYVRGYSEGLKPDGPNQENL